MLTPSSETVASVRAEGSAASIKLDPVGNSDAVAGEEQDSEHDVHDRDEEDHGVICQRGQGAEQRCPNNLDQMLKRIQHGNIGVILQKLRFPHDRRYEEHNLYEACHDLRNVAESCRDNADIERRECTIERK